MPTVRPILLGLAFLLGGCAGPREYAPDSPHYAYPADLKIDLNRPLAIPPGQASVRLQYGRAVARNGVEETEPYCIFEIDTVSDSPQAVQPDRFRITRFQRRVETFSGMPALPWHVVAIGNDDDGGPSLLYFISEFRLHSATQPGVRSLTCQVNQAGAAIPRHLTLAEIRQALGTYFSLELPRQSSV